MSTGIDRIFDAYEKGRISRRDVLTAIASFVALGSGAGCASGAAASAASGAEPRRPAPRSHINHINLRVADVGRSHAFYDRFFGLAITHTPTYHALDCGDGTFISLQTKRDIDLETFRTSPDAVEWARTPDESPGTIEHFCLEVEDFDLERTRDELLAAGHEAIEIAGNLLTADPDGILVQIVDADYTFYHEDLADPDTHED